MEIIVKSPKECSKEEINEFIKLVSEGGEVDIRGLEERVQRARNLFFLKNPHLVAISAIKRFYQQYKNSIFEKAGCSDIANDYKFEMGWMYTKPISRRKGFSRDLLEVMLNQLKGISCYTIVGSENHIMQHMLESHGFNKVGKEYSSSNNISNKINLYIKPN
ncbi:MAG: N-acetyltransferase [Candidatus Omnitrophica bacterium]|nr:N-acetyltransferase [Candidatus Omnitrophota bacterium]